MNIARRVNISGVVHGVGFRPFLKRLAETVDVNGHVISTETGLDIHVEGAEAAVISFLEYIRTDSPPNSRVIDLTDSEVAVQGLVDFRLLQRENIAPETAGIPYDMAVCPECLSELFDENSPRYRYPFISCPQCGERFSVANGIPFERGTTAWRGFDPCDSCMIEGSDPVRRRFGHHLISCPDCGPKYTLSDSSGFALKTSNPLSDASHALRNGEIVAVEGISGFHIVLDAKNLPLMDILRFRSGLPRKPLVLMARDVEAVERICLLSEDERITLTSSRAPVVLLKKRREHLNDMCDALSPYLANIAIVLPYIPVHHLLFADTGLSYLVYSQGNTSEEPILARMDDAVSKLSGVVDKILHHNLPISNRTDNSVGFVCEGEFFVTRRGRGFVPERMELSVSGPCVIGAGAEMRASFAVTAGKWAWTSPFIGNMDNRDALEYYNSSLKNTLSWIRGEPTLVVRDLHDAFFTSNHADSLGLPVKKLQHHLAHVYAVMAEKKLDPALDCLALILDGSGLGEDGNIWGGEIFRVKGAESERLMHLRYIPQPGNERAEKDLGRMAFSVLTTLYGHIPDEYASLFPDWDQEYFRALGTVIDSERTYLTSSLERYLDAVAFLLGICEQNTFGREAMLRLESFMDRDESGRYEYSVDNRIIDIIPAFKGVMTDISEQVEKAVISTRFQNTVVDALSDAVLKQVERTGIRRVILSGAAYQNEYLLAELKRRIDGLGCEMYYNTSMPFNDQSISLGQAFYGLLTLCD